jgi:hypothetical protein
VAPIELVEVDTCLTGLQEAAATLVWLASAEVFDAGPVAR